MRGIRVFLVLLLTAFVLAPIGAQQPTGLNYRILISNDDGVRAEGLRHVASILQAIGNVTIVAPSENQSGKGHSIITSEPVFREDITIANGLPAIGLSATPATTVNIAIRNIMQPRPDLVVSGINRGYNLGHSGYLSGTVGAAREAAMHGIPAIAASLAEGGAPRDYIYAAEEVLGVARRLKGRGGLPPNTFLNVNIPPMPQGGYKGYLVTTQALQRGGQESFAEVKHPRNGLPIYFNVFKEGMSGPEGTDLWAVENGYVSVTPMKLGETDTAQIDPLKAWFK
jgi:5'-nucleotidase